MPKNRIALACACGTLVTSTASAQQTAPLPAVAVAPTNVLLPNYGGVPIGEIGGLEVGAFLARANDSSSVFYNHAVFIPLPRNQLQAALVNGKVDIVAAMVTVTPEREQLADFSEPTRTNVSEVVVTGPGAPPVASLDDLSGQEVFVRKGSIYAESIERLNGELRARGKAPAVILPAPDVLEDDDLLEMVNAGLTKITVVDDYLADFWAKVLPGLTVHNDLAVRTDGKLAVAMRKGSPQLQETVNAFLRRYAKGGCHSQHT